jgi:hypothetical protein
MSKNGKQHWPTKKVMAQIYAQKLWGDNGAEFYSGEGSHHPLLVEPYVAEIKRFLSSFDESLTVCDLGCGDFNIGRQLFRHTNHYIGVDIVPELITYNQSVYKAPQLEFLCMDIVTDDLPPADCVLLRQVLQHLSNAEIIRIIEKLYNYRYVIITEHLPFGEFVPNKDILSGQGIRLKKQSGVVLNDPPFNFLFNECNELLSLVPDKGKGIIKTIMYKVF